MLVYTAITLGYDQLLGVPQSFRSQASFVAYLESTEAPEPWQIRPLARMFDDPTRDAKIYKVLPHLYFPEAACTLWMDGKMEIAAPVDRLMDYMGDADIVAFNHPLRCCLYQEACQCIHRKLDDREIIYRQVQRYTCEGFPENWGLVDCAVLLRRHSARMTRFSEMWWEEISRGSRRDQLSFMYCIWKCGLKVRLFPAFTHNSSIFNMHSHLRNYPPLAIGRSSGQSHVQPVRYA